MYDSTDELEFLIDTFEELLSISLYKILVIDPVVLAIRRDLLLITLWLIARLTGSHK